MDGHDQVGRLSPRALLGLRRGEEPRRNTRLQVASVPERELIVSIYDLEHLRAEGLRALERNTYSTITVSNR